MSGAMVYYPFELHCHTIHSDGRFTPRELVEAAAERGLRGIALTDHNTASGVDEAVRAGEESGVVVIPGIEWTTFYGHITVLGGHSDIDWRTVTPDNASDKILRATQSGDIASLAHPYRVGYPVCTGGRSEFPAEIFDVLTGYEVCSGLLDDPTNSRSLKEYSELVSSGKRLAALYGRDWHAKGNDNGFGVTLIGISGVINAENALEAIRNGYTAVADGSGHIIIKTPSEAYGRKQ